MALPSLVHHYLQTLDFDNRKGAIPLYLTKTWKAYMLQQVMFCINLIYQLIFLIYKDKANNIN